MNGLCSILMIGALLLLCSDRLKSQSESINHNQIELIKHLSGTVQDYITRNMFYIFEDEYLTAINSESKGDLPPAEIPVNVKKWVNSFQIQSKSEDISYSRKFNTSKVNHLQSSMTGEQKIDSTLSERWDTLTSLWVDNSKVVYTYIDYGKETSVEYRWDESIRQWVAQRKDERTYDSYGNEILWIEYQWEISTSQWVSFYKDERAFDGYGNITLQYTYEWDISLSQWVSTFKIINKVDAYGHITLGMIYLWDKTRSLYIDNSKTEFTYNAGGKLTLLISYYWDKTASQWINSGKDEFVYEGNGNKITDIISFWNNTTSQWISTKYEYTYDANGKETSYISYQSDTTASQWLVSGKEEITYNTNGKQLIFSDWDNTASEWINSHKDELHYDGKGNITLRYVYQWDISTSQWVASLSDESTFDTFGDQTLWIYSARDNTINQLIPVYKETYYYSEHNILPEIPGKQINVYPNPASEYILFNLGNISDPAIVEIFSTQGGKVLEQDISKNRQINVSKLAGGLYLYRLNYGGKIFNGKFIVGK